VGHAVVQEDQIGITRVINGFLTGVLSIIRDILFSNLYFTQTDTSGLKNGAVVSSGVFNVI
jgi:hypothetical protein